MNSWTKWYLRGQWDALPDVAGNMRDELPWGTLDYMAWRNGVKVGTRRKTR